MIRKPIQLPLHSDQSRTLAHRLAQILALVAALFCLVIAARMIFTSIQTWRESPIYFSAAAPDPSEAALLQELHAAQSELLLHPESDPLKSRIRQIDYTLRHNYFNRHATRTHGAYLLLGGLIVLIVALKAGAQWSGRPPGIMTVFAPHKDAGVATRRALIATAVLVTIVLGAIPLFLRGPETPSVATQPVPPAVALVDLSANWPSFHGPQGSGITAFASAPTSWDGPSQKNIAWKTPVPLPGQNSPIIWADRVFLSGASADKQEVFCFALNTGALLWRRTVTGPFSGNDVQPAEDAGFAPNTLATDGQRVYALFPTGDLAAFDLAGKPLWSKNLGKPDSTYGLAASLAAHLDRVIVQFDHGSDEKTATSFLLCLDGASGNEVWKTRRQLPSSWSSPIVIYPDNNPAKAQIICAGRPWLIAYDPAAGRELWKAEVLDAEVAPTPVFADNKVFIANEGAVAAAVSLEGKVLWKAEENLPDIVSPLATKDFVLTTTSVGLLACYNAATGEKRWEHDLEAAVNASPVLVGNLVYILDARGTMHIFEVLPQFKEIAAPSIHEDIAGSPAFAAGKIVIRGKKNLYCITGEPVR